MKSSTSTSAQVVIVNPVATDRWRHTVNELHNWRWIYFGRNVERYYKIKQALLDKGQMLNAGELINQIAQEIRAEFINFDQHIRLGKEELLWQTTDLAEKNPYTSNFFFHCCAYLLFNRILQSLDGDFLVFVEDWFLGWLMAGHARKMGFATEQLAGESLMDRLPNWMKYIRYRVWQVRKAVDCRIRFIREFRHKKQVIAEHARINPVNPENGSDKLDILLVTWADPESFRPDSPIQKDTYYGKLPELLREHGQRIGYIANSASWVFPLEQIVQNVKAAHDQVVLPEECLELRDVIRIAWMTWCKTWQLKSRFVLQDVDLSELLADEIRREKTKLRQCWATQFYYIGRFLLEGGYDPTVVLHLYENQPWEKAWRLGIKRYLPRTKVVGYLHAPFAPLCLSYYLSEQDWRMFQLPDRIVTLGPRWEKVLLSEHNYPFGRLSSGAALRFEHILNQVEHNKKENGQSEKFGRGRVKTIFVPAQIGYAESFELLCKTIETFLGESEIEVLIKFHPKMGANGPQLVQSVLECLNLNSLPEHFTIAKQPVSELLKGVDLVIHNGTSVALEALATGKPVLFVRSDVWFDMNTQAFCPDSTLVARTPHEIRQAVQGLVGADQKNSWEGPKKEKIILEESFGPVRENTIESFLGFDEVYI